LTTLTLKNVAVRSPPVLYKVVCEYFYIKNISNWVSGVFFIKNYSQIVFRSIFYKNIYPAIFY
jgi:hypothetical protein